MRTGFVLSRDLTDSSSGHRQANIASVRSGESAAPSHEAESMDYDESQETALTASMEE